MVIFFGVVLTLSVIDIASVVIFVWSLLGDWPYLVTTHRG
jgi:hypothetical protein